MAAPVAGKTGCVAHAELAIFDVNETLSDLELLRDRFRELGAPEDLLDSWFPSVLRDGMALAVNGAYAEFKAIAVADLRGRLGQVEALRDDPEAAADRIVAGLGELDLHGDVAGGLRTLAGAGVRIVTLTVGSKQNSIRLLERAGLADLAEGHFSAEDVRRWKPAPDPYRHVTSTCGVPPERCILIAAHPWDIDGAKRAGLGAAWLNRRGAEYPDFFEPPDITAASLTALATALLDATQ